MFTNDFNFLDCDCFSKNLTKIIHLNDSQSYAIKHGSVAQYCEPNSICEHARVRINFYLVVLSVVKSV